MDTILQDIRYSLRQLQRSPVFVLTAILCVAIGVSANTTIFSLFNALLLRPIAGISGPEQLVEVGRSGDGGVDSLPYPTWRDLQEGSGSVEIALHDFASVSISEGDEPQVLLGSAVTGNYFSVLGLRPAAGRFFQPEEVPVANPAAVSVISHSLWQRRFAGDPTILGRTVRINSRPVTVIGVGPAGFRGHLNVLPIDIWVPLGFEAPGLPSQQSLNGERNYFMLGVGRLADGASAATASAELNGLLERMVEARPFLDDDGIAVLPLKPLPAFVHEMVQLFVLLLMVVVGLVLLIACINVAGMLLVRAIGRAREVAIRQVLGASRGRILRQLLTETLLLFSLGGSVGVVASIWATRALMTFEPPTPPPFKLAFDLSMDYRVLFFSLALTLATGLVFGLGPAWRASRPGLVSSLKEDRLNSSFRRSPSRALLIGAQMALTLLLLVGAGLFLRALGRAQSIDPGFNPAGVEVVSFDLELHGYHSGDGLRFYEQLRRRVAVLPGVAASGLTMRLPLGLPATTSYGGVNVEGVEPPPGSRSYPAPVNVVSPGYFAALGLPLVEGRDFMPEDRGGSANVVIVNESIARLFFGNGSAVGRTLIQGTAEQGPRYQIVGVVGDSKYASLREEGTLFYYLPLAQRYQSAMALLVRGIDGSPPPTALVREAVDELDTSLPFMEVVSLRDYVAITYLPQQVAGLVAGLLGFVGLLLGAVGIAGVAAYMTQQRFREIGVRMALGAGRSELTRFFVRQGMGAPLAGAIVGLGLAVAATRFLTSFLFGISPLDMSTLVLVSTLMLTVALLANWLPTRRAIRQDPLRMLRHE